ncbi:hypothetical protein K2Z84_21440 [Candidatus Binatia bacterium]|nr:hypothetical protein [Candidatus Binatia bacterium]
MSTYATNITPDVEQVLRASTITDTLLVLPQQLDRKLYVAVDKVLKAAGGKWNRKLGGHAFERDPREILGLALETGAIVAPRGSRSTRDLAQHHTAKAGGLADQLGTYCAGPETDTYGTLCDMHAAGLVTLRGDQHWHLTRAAAESVLLPGESLDPEDFPS